MNLPPLPTIDGHLFVDNSHWIEGMMTCHRKLSFQSLFGRISAGEKSALNFGTCIHLALEYRYVKYQNRPVDDQYYSDIGEMITKFYEDHPPEETDWRTLNWCLEVVRRYNERYPIEDFGLLEYSAPVVCPMCKGNGEINSTICKWCSGDTIRSSMVEIPFSLPLFSTKHPIDDSPLTINYTGRIDLPVSIDGGIFVTDHKTTSMGGSMFWNEQGMSSQHRGYVWAFKQITNLPVRGYQVNMIRTKEPPQYVLSGKPFKGKSQSPEQWWQESLQREKFYCSDENIQEWKNNVIEHIEVFLWNYGRGVIHFSPKECSRYGRCIYYDVCKLEKQDRGMLLNSGLFQDNKWSPLNK